MNNLTWDALNWSEVEISLFHLFAIISLKKKRVKNLMTVQIMIMRISWMRFLFEITKICSFIHLFNNISKNRKYQ